MGIVVTVFMILILLLSVPNPLRAGLQKNQVIFASLALLAGLWNVLWYGSQHLGEFWGNAAFVSGLLMTFTSLLLIKTWPLVEKLNNILPAIVRIAALLALAGYTSFYAYTLILMNL